MNELLKIEINENQEPTMNGRELYEFLEIGDNYTDWFKRMVTYGFTESEDFVGFSRESNGGRPSTDHIIKLDMAKEIAMIQRSAKGKIARQYFLQIEKEWNSPEKVMARALKLAERSINDLKLSNSKLIVENTIMQPKSEYFDELVDRNLLTNFRDTAKELKVPQNKFVTFLLERKFIYRDIKGKIKPFAGHEDIFEVKETMNEKTGWAGIQTLITPKGRETFRLLMI